MNFQDVQCGDRVVVTGPSFAGLVTLRERTGVVVEKRRDPFMGKVGVQFDEPFPQGHSCCGAGTHGRCRWGSAEDLELESFFSPPTTIKFSFDDLMKYDQSSKESRIK